MKINKLFSLLVILALLMAGMPVMTAGAAGTVTVMASDVGVSWFTAPPTADTRTGGSVSFVVGPAAVPLGLGSLQMTTTDAGGSGQAKAQAITGLYVGTPLSSITSMSYFAYRDSSSTNPLTQTISINIAVDYKGDGSSFTTLVFEPNYQPGGIGAMQLDTWQLWDAYNNGSAKWWSTKPIPGVCDFNCFIPWSTILASNPDAKVSGIFGVNVGSGWNGQFIGAIDGLTIGVSGVNTTYDFEPTPPDNDGPVTTNVLASPNPAAINSSVSVTANVYDTTTGGSNIALAQYSLDNGMNWSAMMASDGVFDEVSEDVTANFTASAEPGVYDLCVRGTDAAGNAGEKECIMFVVYDPSGGFVTGGGWIDSPAAQTEAAFNSIPDPLAGNYPSQPYQAQQTAEFGDHIQFAGTARDLSSVTVTMSSWAKHSDYPAMPAEGFTHPLTLNIYNVDNSGATPALGTLIKSVTQDFVMQWRPEADPTCSGGTAWRAGDGTCYNGFAFNIVFDLSNEGITLPNEIIYGIASNTQTWGYAPIGAPGPYNSLNFALATILAPSTGTDVEPDAVFWNTKTAAWYSDGGAGGTGTFRRDTGWTGYVPAIRFSVTTPGAYTADPTLGGKATFGFVSKYKKGASIPDGNTEFKFVAGGLNFSSTSYQWLVVNQAGTNAQFKGVGTINGQGSYKFQLWAGDGTPDTFRIKIWYEDGGSEVVVYDNGTDQAIGGGSIVVHKK